MHVPAGDDHRVRQVLGGHRRVQRHQVHRHDAEQVQGQAGTRQAPPLHRETSQAQGMPNWW